MIKTEERSIPNLQDAPRDPRWTTYVDPGDMLETLFQDPRLQRKDKIFCWVSDRIALDFDTPDPNIYWPIIQNCVAGLRGYENGHYSRTWGDPQNPIQLSQIQAHPLALLRDIFVALTATEALRKQYTTVDTKATVLIQFLDFGMDRWDCKLFAEGCLKSFPNAKFVATVQDGDTAPGIGRVEILKR